MNTTQRFIVEIVLSDKVTSDGDIDEMAQNIADALVDKCNKSEVGIAPEDSDAFVEIIYVKGWYSDKQIIEHP
jgi:hypothetical protein